MYEGEEGEVCPKEREEFSDDRHTKVSFYSVDTNEKHQPWCDSS